MRKRIAILVGQADEEYQSRFINGYLKQAFIHDFDTCIFSMYRKYQSTDVREEGETNIFNIVNYDKFDAVVMLKDTIQSANLADNLEEKLHNDFKGPVIVIEQNSKYYKTINTDGYSSTVLVVSHMIETHGYKDIAFLTGKKWHIHSKQRLQAFRDTMAAHGLPVNEDWILYGDFWYKSGEQALDQLLKTNGPMPRAIVCANDCMAIGLCEALEKRGFKIPEDIAVAGYDSSVEGRESPVPLTSVQVPSIEIGERAVQFLLDAFGGRDDDSPIPPLTGNLTVGCSCGCHMDKSDYPTAVRKEWATETSSEGFYSINALMSEELMLQENLHDLLHAVYSYAYQLKEAESFHLCLNSPLKSLDETADLSIPNKGYSENIIHSISYHAGEDNDYVGLDHYFSASEMLPELFLNRDHPAAYIFTPVFYEKNCFGYAVISYGQAPRSYDNTYRLWIETVERGFEDVRRSATIRTLNKLSLSGRKSKFNIESVEIEKLSETEKAELKVVEEILDNNLLTYHFQPIISVKDGSIYSYEALMRSTTEQKVPPLSIIKYANMLGRISDIESATFMNVLHVIENNMQNLNGKKVFLNSIPGVRLSDEERLTIGDLLTKTSDNVVVELTEESEISENALADLKNFYHTHHIETAVDDYGTGYSNINNLLRYMPDYVKIDRSLITEIQNSTQKLHFVREIISFCHDNDILALAEGVETSDELKTVIHLGADLIQGYYTAMPSTTIIPEIPSEIRKEIVKYHREYLAGQSDQIFIAGKSSRILLSNMQKDSVSEIRIGEGNMIYNDISIIGTPGLVYDINIVICPGYKGILTLENTSIGNQKSIPCIELSDNCDVTLILNGENVLRGGGIRVPESSRLTFEGNGNLFFEINSPESIGIGNSFTKRHGDLIFHQDGKLVFKIDGKDCICIGSGLGGNIFIEKGQYIISVNVELGIGIGSVNGDTNLRIVECILDADIYAQKGVGIGSINGNANVYMQHLRYNSFCGAKTFAGIGTLYGESSEIKFDEISADLSLRSDISTCLGALNGKSTIIADHSSVSLEIVGENGLIFGGKDKPSEVFLNSSDIKSNVHNALGIDSYAKDDDFRIINGRCRFMVNDKPVDRKVIYDVGWNNQ